MNDSQPEPLISKREVARRCDVSTKTIDRYRQRPVNPLPFEKPFERGAVRFRWSEVLAWFEGGHQSDTQPARPTHEPSAKPVLVAAPEEGHPRDSFLQVVDAGCDDRRAWELLAAAAEEALSLELSAEAFDAVARVEQVYRDAAGLPARSRRRLRSVREREGA